MENYMARNSRQSKILDIITNQEIETQEELVDALRKAEFDVTQATISRDIKKLGLIKILSDSKKYKYAIVSSNQQSISNKCLSIFKECLISIKQAQNIAVVKVLRGTAGMVASFIDQTSMPTILGITYGDDTVMVVCQNNEDCLATIDKLNEMII